MTHSPNNSPSRAASISLRLRGAVAATALLACAACSRSGGDTDPAPSPTLPLGVYTVSSPTCASTGAAPAYPDHDRKAALLAFDNLTSHTLTVRAGDVVEVFRDPNCTLTLTRSIARNAAPLFALRRDRRHVFEPAGCALSVEVNGEKREVSLATTELFMDRSDLDPEIPFVRVAGSATSTTLDTPGDEELSTLWAQYGCPPEDRLQVVVQPSVTP